MKRIYKLDYLRGFAAFCIMLYHYLSWTYGEYNSEDFFGRIGIYGVSIFYILSGLTLFHVYKDKLDFKKKELIDFFKKRFFRIFPLLWLITITAFIFNRQIGLDKLLLNLTGLFSIIHRDSYIATGSWSIGNEIVFYIFFPVFVIFSRHNKVYFNILCSIILIIFLYFTFFIFTHQNKLENQWINYINPLNQIFYFLGGFLIGLSSKNKTFSNNFLLVLLFTSVTIFCLYPVKGDLINIVGGINRIIFSFCCFFICFCFFKFNFFVLKPIHTALVGLGEISYSVYLVHPLVFSKTPQIFDFIKKHFHYNILFYNEIYPLKIIIDMILTLLISYLVYTFFEKFFMNLGKRISFYKKISND